MVTDISKMTEFSAPVSSGLFPQLAISLISIGLFLAAWLFVFENGTKKSRSYVKEGVAALLSSFVLGFGIVFLFLWVGIYV